MKFLNEIKATNNNILDVKKLGFEITNTDLPLEVGETKYDPDAETLITRITNDDYLRHGEMEILKVRNETGTAIAKGSAVYVIGGIPNSPILLVGLVNNNKILEAERFIGLTTTIIPNNSFGKVITSGVIEGLNLPGVFGIDGGTPQTLDAEFLINIDGGVPSIEPTEIIDGGDTSSKIEWDVGEFAYITTNGEYTNVPPEKGLATIKVGIVIRVGIDTGAILVFSKFEPFLKMLSDVSISNPQNGDILRYNEEFGIWVNEKPETIESSAIMVEYNNESTGLNAENVQTALDSLFQLFLSSFGINGGTPQTSDIQFLVNTDGGTPSIEPTQNIDGGTPSSS